ncbi:SH3 domain-containing protein [Pseudomonas baltica]|uniref:SH3 domain-containing protein n=1 Tax=Pseudomonas baltica TaxID=2762576 RepID=UPI003908A10D
MIWGSRDKSNPRSPSGGSPPLATPTSTASQLVAPAPQARSSFIDADRLNVRSTPKGSIVSSLARGAAVQVYEQRDGWSRISKPGEIGRWVSSSSLCATAECWIRRATVTNTPPAPAKPYTPPAQRTAPSSYSSSCPCSSTTVCIGPRGGRYCITSGGNKRYGV